MYIAKGKDRLVLVILELGIVIKFPIIKLRRCFGQIWPLIKSGRWDCLRLECFLWKPESDYVVSGHILKGIISNLRERALWKRTHSQFLQPTYLSVFGLLNIQKYGKPHDSPYLDLWDQIRRITNQEAYLNCHQFSEVSNYTVEDGVLKALDYGGKGSTWVVVKHGDRIIKEFDFDFKYTRPPLVEV